MRWDKYYDRQGKLISEHQYLRLRYIDSKTRNADYIIVKQENIGKYFVSTVWLGINHNLGGVGEPLIFETMVFLGNDSEDLYMDRYSTEAEAVAGHAIAVEWAKENQ